MRQIPKNYTGGVDFNEFRITFAREIRKITALDEDRVILAEPEVQNEPRPKKPYFSFKMTQAAAKFGDDSKDEVFKVDPSTGLNTATTVWNSGGVRRMTVAFDCYGQSHEEAYNYMLAWQCALDREDIQEDLRRVGIAVWTIGNVADLSQLLNTGYEGRSHMECTFGFAVNTQSDIGEIVEVTVQGAVKHEQGEANIVLDVVE